MKTLKLLLCLVPSFMAAQQIPEIQFDRMSVINASMCQSYINDDFVLVINVNPVDTPDVTYTYAQRWSNDFQTKRWEKKLIVNNTQTVFTTAAHIHQPDTRPGRTEEYLVIGGVTNVTNSAGHNVKAGFLQPFLLGGHSDINDIGAKEYHLFYDDNGQNHTYFSDFEAPDLNKWEFYAVGFETTEDNPSTSLKHGRVYSIKTNALPSILWEKRIANNVNGQWAHCALNDIEMTSTGLIVTGMMNRTNIGLVDQRPLTYVSKIDWNGTVSWENTFDQGAGPHNFRGVRSVANSDYVYTAVNSSSAHAFNITKLDVSNGNHIEYHFPNNSDDLFLQDLQFNMNGDLQAHGIFLESSPINGVLMNQNYTITFDLNAKKFDPIRKYPFWAEGQYQTAGSSPMLYPYNGSFPFIYTPRTMFMTDNTMYFLNLREIGEKRLALVVDQLDKKNELPKICGPTEEILTTSYGTGHFSVTNPLIIPRPTDELMIDDRLMDRIESTIKYCKQEYKRSLADNSLMEEVQINVSPNPTKGELKIELNGNDKPFTMSLVDMQGKLILEQDIHAGFSKQYLQLGHLPKGFYHISISGEGFYQKEKLLLQ